MVVTVLNGAGVVTVTLNEDCTVVVQLVGAGLEMLKVWIEPWLPLTAMPLGSSTLLLLCGAMFGTVAGWTAAALPLSMLVIATVLPAGKGLLFTSLNCNWNTLVALALIDPRSFGVRASKDTLLP